MSLKLVTAFTPQAYSFVYPWQDAEFAAPIILDRDAQKDLKKMFRVLAIIARNDDYKLFSDTQNVALHLKSLRDYQRIAIADGDGDMVEHEIAQFDYRYPLSKAEEHRFNLQTYADKIIGLENLVQFTVDPIMNSINIAAADKESYFDFADAAEHDPFIERLTKAAYAGPTLQMAGA